MQSFKAPLDNLSKGITAFCILISLFFPLSILIPLFNKQPLPFTVSFVLAPVTVFLWGVMIAMYLYRPLAYGIDDKIFFVRRLAGRYTVSLPDIKNIRALEPGETLFAIRTFGNGGLFGYTGLYYNKNLGRMTWFTTQRRNYVLIETIHLKKIIVTPNDPEGFLKAAKLRIQTR